jgi:hypothetical protein
VTVDLRTTYLGLELRSPLVASPSPLTRELDSVLQLVAAGAAAIVLPSLFEEEIVHEELELNRSLEAGSDQFARPSPFPRSTVHRRRGPVLARLRKIKAARVFRDCQPERDDGGRLGFATRGSCRGGRRARAQPATAADPTRTAAEMVPST